MKAQLLKWGMAIFPAVLLTLVLPLTAGAQNFPSTTEGFESGYDGWTTDNTNIWKVGVPTAGPGKAYDGTNCAGTGLTGNAPANQSSRLISPAFVVPAATNYPRLRWWQWFQFGASDSGSDGGNVQISTNNGTSWQTLTSVGGTSGGWSEPSVDLSAYAGQSVEIAFQFHSGNYYYGGGTGWFVDDVTLVTGAITTLTPNVPVGFENGLGDWWVANGVWQVGKPTAGPGAAYDGTNCAGTGLTGNAPANQTGWLLSPVFVVPAANQNPRVRWWQWFHFGASDSGTDVGDFMISTNAGASWQAVASVTGSSGGWSEGSVNLTAYAGQSVQIAFYFQSGNYYYGGGPGWFVDDVTLVTGAITTLTPNTPVGFENGMGDWSVDNGVWAVGVPTAGPGKAYDGTNCAGTGLTGNAPANQSSRLISPAFVVPAATNYPRLRWWQWFQFGASDSGSDGGNVQISTNNGTSWQTLTSVGGTSGGWSEPSVDLSAYAGQSVEIAFQFHSGNYYYGGGTGWFVDDVTLVTGAITTLTPNVPVGFENGLGDWWVANGVWQVGKPTAGPGAAYDGTNCAGTGLTGNAPANQTGWLVSPVFVVPAANQNPRVRWWQWFHFGASDSGTDVGDFMISTNAGASWQAVASVTGSSGGWSEGSVNLTAYAGQSVQIAFYFQSGNYYYGGGPGWFVDDVTLVTGAITTLTPNTPVGFENGMGDWSVDNGVWAVGVPTAGPGKAYDGTNCAGTGLTGNAPANQSSRLISPAFVVPAATNYPRLRWWQWFQFGASDSGSDGGNVQISTNNGTSWQTLTSVGGTSGGWSEPSVDLSAYAGQSVEIAFQFHSGNYYYGGGTGWFVDDVTLVTGAITTLTPNVPVGFENGLGDWWVANGVWQVGKPTAGPGAAYDGTNCAGTGLTGNAPANQTGWLVSPVFVVPAANQNPRVRWWQWFHFGASDSGTDVGDFMISTNAGASWQAVASVTGSSGGWSEGSVNLTAYAGQSVQIAFYFQSGNYYYGGGPGWFVDDVELRSGPDVFNNPETFEFGWGDWSTDNYGLWQIGIPTFGPPITNSSRAHSPVSVAATILNGNYSANSAGRLISPSFTVPSVNPGSVLALRFWQYYQYGTGDAGLVQIAPVSSPTNWTTLTLAATNGTSTNWSEAIVDLTPYEGQQVRIGFYHTANSDASVGAGWYLDDVSLSSFVPTPLTLGQPLTNTFTANGQYTYFAVQVPAGGHLLVNLNALGAQGYNELYLSRGVLPTPGSYDYKFSIIGANQTIFAPNAGAGTWYVLAYNASGSVPENYTLTAQFLTGIYLTSANPTNIGNSVSSSVTINGAGLSQGDTVALVNDGSVYPATNVFAVSASQIIADFNFPAIPTNNYQLTVSSGTNSASLPFTLIQGIGPKLVTQLHVPSRIGYHQPSTIYVEYSNTGDAPMPAPLLMVSADQNGVQGAILTLDPSKVGQYFWTASLPAGYEHSVQFLASGATPGLLQPGESMTVPVYYAGWQQPWNFGYPLIYFSLGILTATNNDLIDWPSLEAGMIPTTIPTDAWNAIFANLTNRVGNTWGGYVQALDDNATYLAKLGENVTDIPDLLSFMVQQASGLTAVHTLAGSVDAQMTAPGPSLIFQRTFTTDIRDHYRLGRLGRGWFDNWDMTLTVTNDTANGQPGTVTILGPGSSYRVFQPDSRNTANYITTLAGDTGTLTGLGGGAYLLTEANGTQYAFRSDGNLNYVADTHGTRITASYSGNQLTQLTHSTGPYLQFTYNGSGRIASVTDSFGRATTFTYDASGEHLVSAVNYRGEQTTYSYSIGLGAPSEHALTQVVNPDGTTLNYSYDSNGRLATRSGCCGAVEQVNYSYDNAGTVTATDALTNSTKSYFDYLGLLVRTEDPLGNVSQRAYDTSGNLLQTTDPAGRTRTYAYDNNGNRLSDSDQLGFTTRYAYTSAFNKLSTLIDASGKVTSYAYNSNGDLVASTYADGSIEHWGYDALGDRLSWTNRRAQQILYTNDAVGRVISKRYPDGSIVTFNYDSRENLTNYIDVTGVTMKQLDTNDRPVQITFPGGQWLQYTYYTGGKRASMTDQLGHRLNYFYDARGRLQLLTDENGSNVVAYAYDAVGRLSAKTLGNGIYTTYGYDAAGHTLDLFNHNANGTTLSRFQYAYDSRGRRTTMTTTYDAGDPRAGIAGMWTYNYDDDGQLIGWTAPNGRTVSYTYDALGNRTLVIDGGTNTIYTVNNLNQYTQVGSILLQYDSDGNLTNIVSGSSATNFIWTADNRLSQIVATGLNWQNYYDALGNRTRIVANSLSKDRVIDQTGFGNLVGEYTHGVGTVLGGYDYGNGLVARKNATGNSDFYMFDALGSVSDLVGNSGVVSNTYAYLPFGELLLDSESSFNPFQFIGELGVIADNSGFNQMHAREFQSSLGRFISRDPIGLAGRDYNFYRYVANEPLDKNDPLGLRVCPAPDFTQCGLPGPNSLACAACLFLPPPEDIACLERCLGAVGSGDTANCIGQKLADYFRCTGLPTFPPVGLPPICQILPLVCISGPTTQPSAPQDPNSLIGPMGYGAANYVSTSTLLPYSIQFENATNATVPAQTVIVSDQLTNNLDWTTFALTEIAFGSTMIAIPSGSQHYANTVHLTQNGFNFDVQIDVGLNPATGLLQATFTSVNPTNGLPPPVTVGFLQPETSPATGVGTGYINYTIRPKAGVATGTQIRSVATISFNQNPAIATDLIDESNLSSGHDTNKQALVTIDADAPTSSVNPLPATATNTTFSVSWSGNDIGSGIVSYDIYVQTNGGAWSIWWPGISATSATFIGQYGKTYGFYSIAHDGAGNTQPTPASANTTTTTLSNYPPTISPVGNQFVVVGQQLVFTNQAYDPDTPLIFSLDPSAPAGATISTNGIFSWNPACAQGSTTNSIKVWVTDSGTPPMSNSVTFVVAVSDCVQVSIGSTVMQIGTTSSVPVNLLSTVALTNLNFTLSYPTNRFNHWTLTPSNAAIGGVLVQTLDPADAYFNIGTTSGQVLQGPALAGIISFGALSNASAFVPLNIVNIQGTKSDGTPVGNTFGIGGRVVVIGPQPLLEAWMATNRRMLTVYGNPGSSYQTLFNTNLLTTNWLAGWRIPQTNLAQSYEANEQLSSVFYRALQFSADPPIIELNSFNGTNMTLLLYGVNGSNYVIQATTNLGAANGWFPATNMTLTNSFQFIGTGSPTNKAMFFRARRP